MADVTIPEDRLFATTVETARILRCDHRTVRKMLESGEIPGFKTGRVWRVPVWWIRERSSAPAPPDPVTAEHLRIRRALGAVDG